MENVAFDGFLHVVVPHFHVVDYWQTHRRGVASFLLFVGRRWGLLALTLNERQRSLLFVKTRVQRTVAVAVAALRVQVQSISVLEQ